MSYTADEKRMFDKIAGCVRALTLEATEKAQSGHPGLPLGCAEFGALLYSELLQHSPKNPNWKNRDRFILSGGHGSMLLYSLLHMSGYDLSMDDIKGFRVLGSKCPGHPEYNETPGVETTTGPLGQGLSTAVGMAIAQKHESEMWNIFDNHIITLAGDGDMMEGVVHEAISYAGMQELNNLIVVYDRNKVTIDGGIEITFTENVSKTFEACGWDTISCNGYDYDEITDAITKAKQSQKKPTLIVMDTFIGKGVPKVENTSKAHAGAMGKDSIAYVREQAGLDAEEFTVPSEVYSFFSKKCKEWAIKSEKWEAENKAVLEEIDNSKMQIDSTITKKIVDSIKPGDMIESRTTLSQYINAIQENDITVMGGTADLNNPCLKTMTKFNVFNPKNRKGNFFNFGVREHGMAAIANGMKLYEPKFTIYSSTFLSFVDYLRPALRLSALMKLPVVYNLAYDSIFIGEDGPTHQPIEQLPSIRCMPNLSIIRPGDAQEGAVSGEMAFSREDGPTAVITTRQKLECFKKEDENWIDNMKKYGAYIVRGEKADLKNIVIATGSEVSSTLKAIEKMENNENIRLISMPCRDIFISSNQELREKLIPKNIKCAVVEASAESGWSEISNMKVVFIGLNQFGTSAPGDIVGKVRGMDSDSIAKRLVQGLER